MDKLGSLHAHEERVRRRSLEAIAASDDLRDHMDLVEACMGMIFACAHGWEHRTENEETLQLLGIRIFNSAATALKLGLSGYYQAAYHHVRDILETGYLVDFLSMEPARIAVWRNAGTKERVRSFGAYEVRKALDRRDGKGGARRTRAYELLSEMSSHVTGPGFLLLAPGGQRQIGAFFDEVQLRGWVEELTSRLLETAEVYSAFFSRLTGSLEPERARFLDRAAAWSERYAVGGERDRTAQA